MLRKRSDHYGICHTRSLKLLPSCDNIVCTISQRAVGVTRTGSLNQEVIMKRSRFISLLLAGILGVTSISFPAEVFGSELDNEVIEVFEEDQKPQDEVVVETEESVDNAAEEAVSEEEVVDKDGEEDDWLQVELTKGGWAIPHFDPANVPEYAISGHFTYQLCVRYEDGTKEYLMYFYRDGIDKLEPARFHQDYLDQVNKSGKLFCYIGVKDGETKHRFDSNYIDYTIPSTRLASPRNIRALDIDGRKIITWDEVPGSDGYYVDVYRDGYDRDKNIPNEIDECSFDLTPILEKYKCGGCELEITANSGDVTQIRCSMPSTFITSDFSLDQDEMRLATGEKKTIKPVFSGTERSLIWTSTDPSVASVDQSGNVTAVGAGEAYISAEIPNGAESTNYCRVTVYDRIRSLKLDPSLKTIGTGDEFVLRADVGAYTVTNSTIITTTGSTVVAGPAVSFKSSDESLLTVTPYGEGKVIVKAASSIGEKTSENAKVIVETTDGSDKTAECNVTINAVDKRVALKKLGLNATSITLNNGNAFRLLPVMTPSNASIKEVNYDYGDENSKNYIEISGRYITAKELPEGVSKAIAKVKVTAEDEFGTVKEAICTVTVVNSEVKVSRITFSQKKISMGSDAVAGFSYAISPEWADNKAIQWSLSENGIVEYDDEGDGYVWITAKKPGTVKLTGTSTDGSNRSASCTITVGNPVDKVTIDKSKLPDSLQVGRSLKLKANVTSSSGKPANTAVTWKSSDKAVATVDKNGKITAKSSGEVTITAYSEDTSEGDGKSDSVTLEIYVPVKKFLMDGKKNITVYEGKFSELQPVFVSPEDATNRIISWKSSNDAVVHLDWTSTISGGRLAFFAMGPGKAKITGTVNDGGKAKITVTVTVLGRMHEEDVKLNIKSYPKKTVTVNDNNSKAVTVSGLNAAKKQTLSLTPVLTAKAANKNVIFTSSDPKAVIVDKKGKITAVGEGKAVITMTTVDGNFTATCTVYTYKK